MSDLNTEEEENQNFSSLIMKKLETREEFIKLKAKLRAQIALALEDTSAQSSPDETAILRTSDDLQLALDLINECLQTLNLKYTSSVFLTEIAQLTTEPILKTRPELLKTYGLADVESDIPVLMKILPQPIRTEEVEQNKDEDHKIDKPDISE